MSLFARILEVSSQIAERRGGAALRDELVAGLAGRALEIGAGTGLNFTHYPATVSELVAIEPEPRLRGAAQRVAGAAPVPVRVIDGRAEALPFADGTFDAVVCASVLCSVTDPNAVLTEIARVLAPGAELRFFEHVASTRRRAAALQRLLDRVGIWRGVMGGCHVARHTEATIRGHGGFAIVAVRRFRFLPIPVDVPVAPKILGRARRV